MVASVARRQTVQVQKPGFEFVARDREIGEVSEKRDLRIEPVSSQDQSAKRVSRKSSQWTGQEASAEFDAIRDQQGFAEGVVHAYVGRDEVQQFRGCVELPKGQLIR